MAAAVEVDEWLEGDLGGRVSGGGELFGCVVVGGYVCLVVFGVVEFHYLAGDGGLEGAVVVFWCLRSAGGEGGGWRGRDPTG